MGYMLKLKSIGDKVNKVYSIVVTKKKSGLGGSHYAKLGVYRLHVKEGGNIRKELIINKKDLVKWLDKGVEVSKQIKRLLKI